MSLIRHQYDIQKSIIVRNLTSKTDCKDACVYWVVTSNTVPFSLLYVHLIEDMFIILKVQFDDLHWSKYEPSNC